MEEGRRRGKRAPATTAREKGEGREERPPPLRMMADELE